MKNISFIIFTFLTNICSAQLAVIDDFDDNDKSLWGGTPSHFIINTSHQLQLNNNVAGTSFVATPFAPSQTNLEWNVYVRQAFAGSANNYGRIYLLSSQFNLTQPTEGYFLQLGEAGSNDAVELFRQSGSAITSVCRAANAAIASSFTIRMKVTRDPAGLWKLLVDYSGGNEFAEAASGIDLTYTTGLWMGMLCVYTAGNANRFFYDDIYAGPPRPEPLPPDIAEPFDLVINEFFPDPSPPVGLAEEEFVEIYNRSSKTFELDKWKLGDATSLVSLPSLTIHPDEYLVVTTSLGLPSLNNAGDAITLIDPDGVLIDSISYSSAWYQDETKASGGYSIERLNPEVSSTDATNWYVSQSDSGGTPGSRNSVFGRNPDSKPPVIESIELINDSSVVVKFSEAVVVNSDNYKLNGSGKVGSVVFDPLDTTVVVSFEGLLNGSINILIIKDIVDLAGNQVVEKEFTFTYFIPHPVHPKYIIITEIMADPAPVVQLPEAEYIELLNKSVHPISLAGWHIEDPTTSAALPPLIVMPNSFLLLTSTTNASRFPNATGVTSFPSLGNPGDRIVLRSSEGTAIDSVAYNTSWYHNSEKSEGGWSLELIDINNPCGESDNWTSSEDTDGGTPGQSNSVFANKPDLTPPGIVSLFPSSPDSLTILFNEKLGDRSLVANYSIPGKAMFVDRGKREVIYLLSERLSTRTEYSFTMTDVEDCSGNVMMPVTISFSLPETAEASDVVINEILFNPRPTGADFIELYNRTGKYINLKGWSVSGEVITTANDILKPGTYRVLTSSIIGTESSYLASVGKSMLEMQLPSMPDDEGEIVLSDPLGVVVDQFAYNADMHSPIVGDPEGVSLERISPETSTDERSNWHSGNASAGYATPGYLNSSSRPSPGLETGTVNITPEVISPSTSAAFSQIFYRFEEAGLVANVSVVDLDGRVVKNIATNETIGAEGSFQWDGDRNEGGPARCGYYMLWFQTFDLGGDVRTYRRRVVVGLP